MKKVFSYFFLSYIFLSIALLAILLAFSVYFFNLSNTNSQNEGYSHLSNRMEILNNDLTRISALISFAGNYNSIVKTASLTMPVSAGDLHVVNEARQDLADAVRALVTDMVVEYVIILHDGLCITADNVYGSITECFGVYLRFSEENEGLYAAPAGFRIPAYYHSSEQDSSERILFSGNISSLNFLYQSNKIIIVIDPAILLKKWLNNDITYVELYANSMLVGSYGVFNPKEKYQIVEYQGSGNYRGIAYIPNSVIWKKIRSVVGLIFISIVIFIITGLGLSVYFSNKHSKPFQKIASQLMHQTNVSSLPANELLFIIHSVEQMGIDMEKTRDILKEQDQMLRLGMFERLLGGHIFTKTEWDKVRFMFGNFPEVWCLCLIRGNYEGNEVPEFVRSGVHLSAQFVSEHFNANTIVHYMGNEDAVIILPINQDKQDTTEYTGILNKTEELMRIKHQLHISIAVSGIFGNIESLSTAYSQARQLLRMSGGRKNLFFMEDEDANLDQFPLDFSDSQRFYELLLGADYEHAELMIKHSFNNFRDLGFVPESVIYHLFWSFEQVFVRIRAENTKDENFHFTLPEYNPLESIEELVEKLLASALVICGNVEKSSRRREMELTASVIGYIDENIADPMLNLSKVSLALSLSERYTQTLIRKSVDKSFFEYVNQKRMKMAYSMLTESAMSINDISIKCGFALRNSFNKAFKRHFGYPPIDLRKET